MYNPHMKLILSCTANGIFMMLGRKLWNTDWCTTQKSDVTQEVVKHQEWCKTSVVSDTQRYCMGLPHQ